MSIDDTVTRILENLGARLNGPMHFRFVLQPVMATIFAIRDGRRDAREGKVAYFWALFTKPGHRMALLRNGWKSVGKIFIFAVILDAIYQFIEFRWFYPGEALIVSFFLAFMPYLLLRGPVNRLISRKGFERSSR